MHASSWPGVQTCVCLHSALFRWWAIISGAGVYCACAYVCDAGGILVDHAIGRWGWHGTYRT